MLSYLMDGEADLCARCFASSGHKYKAAERCVDGKEVGEEAIPQPKKAAKSKALAPKKTAATKKKK